MLSLLQNSGLKPIAIRQTHRLIGETNRLARSSGPQRVVLSVDRSDYSQKVNDQIIVRTPRRSVFFTANEWPLGGAAGGEIIRGFDASRGKEKFQLLIRIRTDGTTHPPFKKINETAQFRMVSSFKESPDYRNFEGTPLVSEKDRSLESVEEMRGYFSMFGKRYAVSLQKQFGSGADIGFSDPVRMLVGCVDAAGRFTQGGTVYDQTKSRFAQHPLGPVPPAEPILARQHVGLSAEGQRIQLSLWWKQGGVSYWTLEIGRKKIRLKEAPITDLLAPA